MGCNQDCLNCQNPVCILDVKDEKPKPNRKAYMHEYYLRRKRGKKYDNHCKWCGKECTGEMIRIDEKNYCGIDCVLCHLYQKNEKKMKMVDV